jgi:DNA-binding response OmpR family regulator
VPKEKASISHKRPQISRSIAPPANPLTDDRDDISVSDKVMLIIEDDSKFAKILSKKCHLKGFKCLMAPTGEMGLELADLHRPNAIILDIELPGIDGWAVLVTLKKNVNTQHIPVYIVSAKDTGVETDIRSLGNGAIGFATKPLKQEDIDSILSKLQKVYSSTHKRVLVVEDDVAVSQQMVELISRADIVVDVAKTGVEAINALCNEYFDCVVLDLKLPEMDGHTVLQMLKNESVELPPVIVSTARELTLAEEKTLSEHTHSIVIKDVRFRERLLEEISLFLHRVVEEIPSVKRKIIQDLHNTDALLRDKKVLIVDDDMRTTFAMARLLTERGMKPLKAENGERALNLLADQPDVDLVLMDIMMPVMDGYTTISRIRQQEQFSKLPIIALTAKAMPEDREKCLVAGANDYLSKPVNIDHLVSMMRLYQRIL